MYVLYLMINGDVLKMCLLLVQLHEGVKKSGIMGFCDPCPGETKHLYLEYTYGANRYEVSICLIIDYPLKSELLLASLTLLSTGYSW